jgi:hypothetical protein
MEKQVLSQLGVWYSYGLVLLIVFIAVAVAAIRDIRLVHAAVGSKPK